VYNDLGTPNLQSLLSGGRCSEEGLFHKDLNWESKKVVAVGKWSLIGSGSCYDSIDIYIIISFLSFAFPCKERNASEEYSKSYCY
jgi:hypothetical protein